MAGVVASALVGGGVAEVELTANASNVVTGITLRNDIPGRSVRFYIRHEGSGYLYEDPNTPGLGRLQVFGDAPVTISLPNPRRFPDDHSVDIRIRGA